MKSVLLISHGILAEGMKKTAEIFFGENIPQFDALCLDVSETAEDYRQRLIDKVNELDNGDGVLVIADLFGGTPCNQCVFLDPSKVTVITGMSLPMVMECLAARESDFDADMFVDGIKGSIVNFSKTLEEKKAEKRARRRKTTEE